MVKKGSFGVGAGSKRRGKASATKNNVQNISIPEGQNDECSQDGSCSAGNSSQDLMRCDDERENKKKSSSSIEKMLERVDRSSNNESEKDDDDEHSLVSSCISENDRESLDVAMRLMNEEELDEIENSSNAMRYDVRKWMLRHNYKSLKEATLYLQSSLKAKSEEAQSAPTLDSKGRVNGERNRDHVDNDGKFPSHHTANKSKTIATKKSIKKVKDQTLATLVIRKNMLGSARQTSTTSASTASNVNV